MFLLDAFVNTTIQNVFVGIAALFKSYDCDVLFYMLQFYAVFRPSQAQKELDTTYTGRTINDDVATVNSHLVETGTQTINMDVSVHVDKYRNIYIYQL